MQRDEKFFVFVLIILLLTPIWGTALNLLGGYLKGPHPQVISSNSEKKWYLGPDEIAYERYLKNKEA